MTQSSGTIPGGASRPEDSQIGGASTFGPAHVPAPRLVYWSVRRELWESRWLYIALLTVAAVTLFGYALSAMGSRHISVIAACNFAAGALMLTYQVVTVIYCLEALHGERRDRSILFWKSLPVSDVIVVSSKASVALIVLPLLTFLLTAGVQLVMLLIASAALAARGGGAGAPWMLFPLLQVWAALLYHLITVHSLYYAPLYGWLLLVSAWARRAPFLWATVPVAALLILEKLIFNTSVFATSLESRLSGGPEAFPFPINGAPASAPALLNVAQFLADPGLWTGLAICAAFLLLAARVRRYQGPA